MKIPLSTVRFLGLQVLSSWPSSLIPILQVLFGFHTCHKKIRRMVGLFEQGALALVCPPLPLELACVRRPPCPSPGETTETTGPTRSWALVVSVPGRTTGVCNFGSEGTNKTPYAYIIIYHI